MLFFTDHYPGKAACFSRQPINNKTKIYYQLIKYLIHVPSNRLSAIRSCLIPNQFLALLFMGLSGTTLAGDLYFFNLGPDLFDLTAAANNKTTITANQPRIMTGKNGIRQDMQGIYYIYTKNTLENRSILPGKTITKIFDIKTFHRDNSWMRLQFGIDAHRPIKKEESIHHNYIKQSRVIDITMQPSVVCKIDNLWSIIGLAHDNVFYKDPHIVSKPASADKAWQLGIGAQYHLNRMTSLKIAFEGKLDNYEIKNALFSGVFLYTKAIHYDDNVQYLILIFTTPRHKYQASPTETSG